MNNLLGSIRLILLLAFAFSCKQKTKRAIEVGDGSKTIEVKYQTPSLDNLRDFVSCCSMETLMEHYDEQSSFVPLWHSFQQKDVNFTDAKIAITEIRTNGQFIGKPRLIALWVNGNEWARIESVIEESVFEDGTLKNGYSYFWGLDLRFLIGYRIEDGKVISEYRTSNPAIPLNESGGAEWFQKNRTFKERVEECDSRIQMDLPFCTEKLKEIKLSKPYNSASERFVQAYQDRPDKY